MQISGYHKEKTLNHIHPRARYRRTDSAETAKSGKDGEVRVCIVDTERKTIQEATSVWHVL